MEQNVLEKLIIPETPRTTDMQKVMVYIPMATHTVEGIAKFNPNDFSFTDAGVTLKYDLSKVVVDFDVNVATGEGTISYSDNTKFTFVFPTVHEDVFKTSLTTQITFAKNSFLKSENAYHLVFTKDKTNQVNSNFITQVEELVENSGYKVVIVDTFKGNDGSIILTTVEPFDGKISIVDDTYLVKLEQFLLPLELANGTDSFQLKTSDSSRKNITDGCRSETIGQHNNNGGYQTYMGGSNNIIPLTDAFQVGNDIVGGQNNIVTASNVIVSGTNNKSSGHGSLLIGDNNSDFFDLDKYNAGNYFSKNSNSALIGDRHVNNAPYSLLTGTKHTNTGQRSLLSGYGHVNTGTYSALFGDTNTNSGTQAFMNGNNNINTGNINFVSGRNCKIEGYNHVSLFGLSVTASRSSQLAAGLYFTPSADALFSIGQTWPLFEVTDAGRARLKTAPVNDDEIVRLKELNDAIDNISTGSGLALPDNITIDETGFTIKKPGSSAVNPHAYIKLDSIEIAEGNYDKLTILKDRINCITKAQYTYEVANSSLRFPDGDVWPGKRDYILPTHHTGSVTLASESWVKDYINQKIAVRTMQIVDVLPTANISTSTLYLLKLTSSSDKNTYAEFIYVNNAWEQVGTTGSVSIDTEPIYRRIENVETQVTTLDGTVLTLDGRVTDIKADVDGITTSVTDIDSKLDGEITTRETAISQINQRADTINQTVKERTEIINTETGEVILITDKVSSIEQFATGISTNLRDNYYNKTTIDEKIADFITNGEISFDGYVKTADLTQELSAYTKTDSIQPSLKALRELYGQAAAFNVVELSPKSVENGLISADEVAQQTDSDGNLLYYDNDYRLTTESATNGVANTALYKYKLTGFADTIHFATGEFTVTGGNIIIDADGNLALRGALLVEEGASIGGLEIKSGTITIDGSDYEYRGLFSKDGSFYIKDTNFDINGVDNWQSEIASTSMLFDAITSKTVDTNFVTATADVTAPRVVTDWLSGYTSGVRAFMDIGSYAGNTITATLINDGKNFQIELSAATNHDIRLSVTYKLKGSSKVHYPSITIASGRNVSSWYETKALFGIEYIYFTDTKTSTMQVENGTRVITSVACDLLPYNSEDLGIGNLDGNSLGNDVRKWLNIYGTSIYGDTVNYVNLNQASDSRLKNGVINISNNYEEFFDKLRPVSYKLNDDKDNKVRFGLIADDVHNALIDLGFAPTAFAMNNSFKKNDIDYKTLAYSEFIALCINEIQKLKKRVKELENK